MGLKISKKDKEGIRHVSIEKPKRRSKPNFKKLGSPMKGNGYNNQGRNQWLKETCFKTTTSSDIGKKLMTPNLKKKIL